MDCNTVCLFLWCGLFAALALSEDPTSSVKATRCDTSSLLHAMPWSEQTPLPYKLLPRGTFESAATVYNSPDCMLSIAQFDSPSFRREVFDKMEKSKAEGPFFSDIDRDREAVLTFTTYKFLRCVYEGLEIDQGLYAWMLELLCKRGASIYLLSNLAEIYNSRSVSVHLSHCPFGLRGANLLSRDIMRHSAFTCISLTNCGIGDKGCAALVDGLVGNAQKLELLNLTANNISDDGAEYLAIIFTSEIRIRSFCVNHNQISDYGALTLAKSLQHFNGLENLDLRYNLISDQGAITLTESVQKNVDLLLWNQKLSFPIMFEPCVAEPFGILKLSKESSIGIPNLVGHSNNLHTINIDGKEIDIEDDMMFFVEILKQCCCLQSLFLKNIDFGDSFDDNFADLFHGSLDHCSNLRTVTVESSKIGSIILESLVNSLKHCGNLHSLTISSTTIGCAGVKLFADSLEHWHDLQLLSLKSNHIGNAGALAIGNALKHCTKLRTLDLELNCISSEGMKALFELRHCSNLQMLNLGSNATGSPGVKVFAEGLKSCSSLKILNLEINHIGDSGAVDLACGLQHCGNLQSLFVKSNNIHADGVQALAESLKDRTNLRELDFSMNKLGDPGLKVFVDILKHSSSHLEVLGFESNNITVDGIKSLIVGLQHWQSLQNLNLRNNKIGDDGAKVLSAGLRHSCNLQVLDLSWNEIRGAGTVALAGALKSCTSLVSLSLESNHVTDIGAEALRDSLKHWENLQVLNLESNRISCQCSKALAGDLKHCTYRKT